MERERRFEELPAWRVAMDFALTVYRISEGWPAAEQTGLTADVRRDAVMVPAKIAHGFGGYAPEGPPTAAHLLDQVAVARRSLRETEVRLNVAHRLGFVDDPTIEGLRTTTDEVRRRLQELIERLPEPEVEIDRFQPLFIDN